MFHYKPYRATVKPETLTSGNFDEFGESDSNQSKATKQNKHTIYSVRKTKISTFTSMSTTFLSSNFFESGFAKV